MQAQKNKNKKSKIELCPKFNEFERFCPDELKFISQIIPFMFIVAKMKSAQHGLTWQCVLVPTRFEESSDHFNKSVW